MNEPLFTEFGNRHPRRRFWTGMPPAAPDKVERPSPGAFATRAVAFAAESLLNGVGLRRPERAG